MTLRIDRRALMQMSLAAPTLLSLGAPRAFAHDLDPVRAFDSFFGAWTVRHRKLKERLAGSDEWTEFDGVQTMRPILAGRGNMTDNAFFMPDGTTQRGVTLRAFDAKTQNWSIWWLDGNHPVKIDTPVVGSFRDGVGAFYADDTFKEKPITVRFL